MLMTTKVDNSYDVSCRPGSYAGEEGSAITGAQGQTAAAEKELRLLTAPETENRKVGQIVDQVCDMGDSGGVGHCKGSKCLNEP
jgi:hypothetical protein